VYVMSALKKNPLKTGEHASYADVPYNTTAVHFEFKGFRYTYNFSFN